MNKSKIPVVQIQGISAGNLIEIIKDTVKELIPVPQPQTQVDRLLTRKEVATLLSVSLVTLHAWVKKGVLNAYRIGNKVRFKESEVLEALQRINSKND